MASDGWPAGDLESVSGCPCCGCGKRTLAHANVQDWAFGCAPGLWNYWGCDQCRCLYLDPRPTPASVGRAYSRYYTHPGEGHGGLLASLKQRLRNECWSHALHTSLAPRLGLPRALGWTLSWLESRIVEPFGLRQMAELPKGLLLDVGCGNGDKLRLAQQLGWDARGIEMDAAAVQAAQAQGLRVVQGGYELLAGYEGQADCIVCSHVLEHVHTPVQMLRMLVAALKPGGVLLLSAPNASSSLRQHYGDNWRGLEAPRHLAIPDARWLIQWMQAAGLQCRQVSPFAIETAIESERIRRRSSRVVPADVVAARQVLETITPAQPGQEDMVQLVCTKAMA
jgi:2-polyprenyl-3-methyl-5-hydroxy-6-metoxy-1,4-benzoquinol methylase